MTLPKNSPKRVVDHYTLQKDYIQQGDINEINPGPEILNDPVLMGQCEKFGYMIYQIGDRLVRVYCKPSSPLIDESAIPTATANIQTGNVQPDAYTSMPVGQDPRVEMSTQDNAELDRNALWEGRKKTKALLETLYKHKLVGGKWVPTPGEVGERQRPTGRQEPPSGARPYNRGTDGFLEPGTKVALREDMWHVVVRDNGESIDAREIGPWSRAQGRRSDMLLSPDDITHTWTEGGTGAYEAPKRRGRHYDPRTGMRIPSERRILHEEDFAKGHPIAKLGTSGPKGPHVTAMWFVKTDDAIYMFTSDVTQKIANIKRDPRVSVLVDTYNPKDVGDVDSRMFYGRAELYERGTPEWEKGVKFILEKYKETGFEEDEEQKIWLAGEDPESKPLVIKILIIETVIPTDKHKLVGGKWVPTPGEEGYDEGKYPGKSSGLKVLSSSRGGGSGEPNQALQDRINRIIDDTPHDLPGLKQVQYVEGWGRGDAKAAISGDTLTIYNTSKLNAGEQVGARQLEYILPHEMAHTISQRELLNNKSDFGKATVEEGGITPYARGALHNSPGRPGNEENFAEWTAMWRTSPEHREEMQTTHPQSYASWHAIMSKYGYAEPTEKGLNPDQPRVPAGSPEGGQFGSTGAPSKPSEREKKFPPGMPTVPEAKPYPPSIPNKQVYGSKPVDTYKGVQIWGAKTLSETDKTLYTQAVKSGMDSLPDKMDHFVSRVVITDEKGPAFMAGGANHIEGGHYNPLTGEVVIRTTSAPSFWAKTGIPHEFAHATWQDMDNKRESFNSKWNAYEHDIAQDMAEKGYPWFGRPSQMEAGASTGEAERRFYPEKWEPDPMYGDRSINDYLTTGPIVKERKMAYGRHGFSDIDRFSESSDKEGGVSKYARDHLKERHYTENFAEMTEQNLGRSYRDFDDPEKGRRSYMLENNKEFYPKTFAAWRNIMLRYGWREPKEASQ